MDTHGVMQRIKQFNNAHGNFVVSGSWIYFEDGACREVNPLGALMDTPTDARTRAKKICYYWTVKLALAAAEFDHYKNQHLGHAINTRREKIASAPIAERKEVTKHLRSLRKKVKTIAAKLEEARAGLEEFKPKRQIEIEKMDEQNRQTAETLIDELASIEI